MDNPGIDLKKLGHRVRELRLGKGWTLADLADHSRLSKSYISDVENGAAGKPNIQYIYSIAKAMGVTLDELLEEATAPAVKPRTSGRELPPGLAALQAELNLSGDDVDRLASINFRGHRPRDKEGWRFLLEALRMVSQRKSQK